jgi:hypothetical protein
MMPPFFSGTRLAKVNANACPGEVVVDNPDQVNIMVNRAGCRIADL